MCVYICISVIISCILPFLVCDLSWCTDATPFSNGARAGRASRVSAHVSALDIGEEQLIDLLRVGSIPC